MSTQTTPKDIQAYRPAERKRVLAEAREAGVIAYDRLDPLLVEACETPAKLRRLVKSLEGVELIDSRDPGDPLAMGIEG